MSPFDALLWEHVERDFELVQANALARVVCDSSRRRFEAADRALAVAFSVDASTIDVLRAALAREEAAELCLRWCDLVIDAFEALQKHRDSIPRDTFQEAA